LQDEKHEIFCIDGMLGMGFILIFLRFYSDRARESTKLKRAFWLLNIGLVVKKLKWLHMIDDTIFSAGIFYFCWFTINETICNFKRKASLRNGRIFCSVSALLLTHRAPLNYLDVKYFDYSSY
jgi:nitric oxide reductase large subunit